MSEPSRGPRRASPGLLGILVTCAALLGACEAREPSTMRGSGGTGRIARVDSAAVDSGSIDSTSVAAAAGVVRDYYAAIDARDYRRAYRRWGDDGRSSGQTYQGFAAGFAHTARVEATIGEPGRMDAAAGSRYVEVPLAVRAVTDRGEEQRFTGRYVMRRSVVDGATEAQRRWHIDSAKMKRVP